jgi:hypothetical protein
MAERENSPRLLLAWRAIKACAVRWNDLESIGHLTNFEIGASRLHDVVTVSPSCPALFETRIASRNF